MPVENPDVIAARAAATFKAAAEFAAARGRTPTAQDRLHVFRDRVQGMSHFDLLNYLGDDWKPPAQNTGPREHVATQDDVVDWLAKHRPNISATERLRECRRMTGKPLPEFTTVSAAEHREQREAHKQEHMRQHLAERAAYRAKFQEGR